MIPPKPSARPEKVSLWRYMKLFRADILSAQPAKLYRAWMAGFKTPFFRSYLANDPELVKRVLKDWPDDFPKSDRIGAGLRPLLGNSVFLTNGEVWKRQRRIIDPAFESGRLRDSYGGMYAAGQAAVVRMQSNLGVQDIEPETSHAAADVIFRTLFSIPIEDEIATAVFEKFRDHQRTQPILNLAAFIPGPKWMPRFFSRSTKYTDADIRRLITDLTQRRMDAIKAGTAPDDLATKIMTTQDPETGATFSTDEMVDQVAIFFLAGHETSASASALAWTLYLLAMYPDWQDKLAEEGAALTSDFSSVSKLCQTRDVFREELRLYPPVPMMVRETACPETMRNRAAPKGSQIVLSPWHLHRHERLWDNPDGFDPTRWGTENGKKMPARRLYPVFERYARLHGGRVCNGRRGFIVSDADAPVPV